MGRGRRFNDKVGGSSRTGRQSDWSAAVAPMQWSIRAPPLARYGSFGGGPGGVGAGVGVAVPVGTRASTAYAANLALTDVATGRMM
jgi:hypothetical protein